MRILPYQPFAQMATTILPLVFITPQLGELYDSNRLRPGAYGPTLNAAIPA
jgi:hypothetical protein